MIRVLVKPVKRIFSKRQWTWEIVGGNGEKIDPRETHNNRADAIDIMETLFSDVGAPVELVVYDAYGEVESRRQLR